MSRDWLLYLEDLLESAQKIRRTPKVSVSKNFARMTCIIDAVVRNLEIIGEAAKHLPVEAKTLMPTVDWSKAAGFRDVIAHSYSGLDLHVIWDVTQTKLPDIVRSAEKVVQQFRSDSGTSTGPSSSD